MTRHHPDVCGPVECDACGAPTALCVECDDAELSLNHAVLCTECEGSPCEICGDRVGVRYVEQVPTHRDDETGEPDEHEPRLRCVDLIACDLRWLGQRYAQLMAACDAHAEEKDDRCPF